MTRRRTRHPGTPRPARRITVRAVRRDPPDIRRLSRTVIQIALEQAQAEAEAASQDAARSHPEAGKEPDDGR